MSMRLTCGHTTRQTLTLQGWRVGGWLTVTALGLLVAAGPAWAQATDQAKPEAPDAKRADVIAITQAFPFFISFSRSLYRVFAMAWTEPHYSLDSRRD